MSLSRGPCFGECPVYTLAFNGDGWVTWLGESFVDRVGLYVGEIGLSAFADLAEFAVKSGFFALDEDYPPPATDLPMYEIVVGTGARDKAARAWGVVSHNRSAILPNGWTRLSMASHGYGLTSSNDEGESRCSNWKGDPPFEWREGCPWDGSRFPGRVTGWPSAAERRVDRFERIVASFRDELWGIRSTL